MSIATSLAALRQAKTDIAVAITDKGGTVNTGDGFADFAAAIAAIPAGAQVQTYSGTLTLSSTGTASATGTINCGFRPDIIVLYGWVYVDGNEMMGLYFQSAETPSATSSYFADGLYYCAATQTATGCNYEIGAQDWSWNAKSVNGISFSVMAIKYT